MKLDTTALTPQTFFLKLLALLVFIAQVVLVVLLELLLAPLVTTAQHKLHSLFLVQEANTVLHLVLPPPLETETVLKVTTVYLKLFPRRLLMEQLVTSVLLVITVLLDLDILFLAKLDITSLTSKRQQLVTVSRALMVSNAILLV